MDSRSHFTPIEDCALWKTAIEVQTTKKLGDVFKQNTQSKRLPASLINRFRRVLLPHLRNTKFHPETKLKLCKTHKVKVDIDFLKELKKDADVQLDRQGYVETYTLKRACRKNRDMLLSDEELLSITLLPVSKYKEYSPDDDLEIWNYVLEKHNEFTREELFWDELSEKINRPNARLLRRFLDHLLPTLHTMKFPVEDALKLYKCCQSPVDAEYLKELKKYAELKVDENACITEYKLKEVRAKKRKNTAKTRGRPKRVRTERSENAATSQEDGESVDEEAESTRPGVSEEAMENSDDEENLIIDNVIPGNGVVINWWPERRNNAPKREWDDYDDEGIPFVAEPIIPQVTPAPSRHERPKAEVHTPMVYGGNELEVAVEEEVAEQEEADQDAENENEWCRQEVEEQGPSTSTETLEKVLKRIGEKMDNQEENIKTIFAEMKNDLEAFFQEKLSKMKAELEVSIETKMIEVMSQGMKCLKNEMKNIRSEKPTTSTKKEYLRNLKNLVTSLGSPETAEIEQKIETMFQSLPENDQTPIPLIKLHGVLEVALTIIKS